MSDWSSFAEDKDYADAWRNFLEEQEEEEKPAKPKPKPEKPKPSKAERGAAAAQAFGKGAKGLGKGIGKGIGKAFKGIKSLPWEKKPEDLLPTIRPTAGIKLGGRFSLGGTKGMKARKALRLTRDLDISRIAKAGERGAQAAAAAAETPPGPEASAANDSIQYRKFKGYVADVVNDRKPDPIKIKQAYQGLSDEQKDEFQDFLDNNALDNPEVVAYFTATLGSVMEQAELSLEELIKEELLRVLNEEE